MIIFGRWPPSRLTVAVALVMAGVTTVALSGPYVIGVGLVCVGVLVGWTPLLDLFRAGD
ncbi:MAG: hypothetical protein QOI10_3105 [Solirubrobacterales bacterium]|jgi:hypothetical protein|nr:hypothetical protein [Solirubrobacterales bacterium]